MILFPAIDLKNGQCVRLSQGDADRVKVYNSDPLDQAKFFEKNGDFWLRKNFEKNSDFWSPGRTEKWLIDSIN